MKDQKEVTTPPNPFVVGEEKPRTTSPKPLEYIGPKPAPVISNLPGTGRKYRADSLPQEYIKFLIDTNPAAKDWFR